jgi:diacylglycerol kinase (ATP)
MPREPDSPPDEAASLKSTGWGVARVLTALRYSLEGLRSAWVRESAFRQEVIVTAILLPLSLFARVTWLEHGLLAASLFLVLLVELINSAIEAVVDRVSPQRHPLSKHAKDVGSAAVLLSLLVAGCIWAAILLPVYWPR